MEPLFYIFRQGVISSKSSIILRFCFCQHSFDKVVFEHSVKQMSLKIVFFENLY